MSDLPFFSILMPTKNRGQLLAKAIESVLSQTFADFEIIVVDNDDGDETSKVVSRFEDPRLQYYRTGGLSMVENWEFGRKRCQGRYLTVLEDKLTYYPWALEKINQLICSEFTDVVVWGVGRNYLECQADIDVLQITERLSCKSILADYIKGRKVWKMMPRLINSCISSELVEEITRTYPGNRFFNYASPDLVAAFCQLAVVDYIKIIHSDLEYRRSSTSASTSVRIYKQQAIGYFSGNSGYAIKDAVSLVPIKNHCLIQNTVYNDFLTTRKLFGGKLDKFQMSEYQYSRMCLRDMCSTLLKGGTILTEFKDIASFMRSRLSFRERSRLWFWWARLVLGKYIFVRIIRPMRRSQ